MKLAFMGSDPIALPMLSHLQGNGWEMAAVFTQPDRRSGRGLKIQPNAIKSWALENGIAVHQPQKCGEPEGELLRAGNIDLVLVMAYGQILPSALLEVPRFGVLNFHASILPRLRGASPIHTAVALGLEHTGVSLMRIVRKLDAGPVADVASIAIQPEDTSSTVHAKLAQACVPLVDRCLPLVQCEALTFKPQNPDEVTYCRIIEKSDCHLDFHAPASVLANRIRAFVPWPGTSFPCNGAEIRIHEAVVVEVSPDPEAEPGTVFSTVGGVLIHCGEGALKATRLQRAGGRALSSDDFLRGFAIQTGTVLESRAMRPLEASQPFPYRRKGNS